ncbi:MAG: transcription antitermination factor NusB [Lachnospiraceae bacterium]|nr:transcription antitermination factor NusB [Lachnospiraceae bacterium]
MSLISRRIFREMAMKLVYQFEFFKKEEMEDQITVFLESQELPASMIRGKAQTVSGDPVKEQEEASAESAAEGEVVNSEKDGTAADPGRDDGVSQETVYEDSPDTVSVPEEDQQEIRARVMAVYEKLPEIDQKISEQSKRWKINRMPKTDLAILRLAAYEILYDENVPDGAAINEAVELAKVYGSGDSYKFVNGVLGGIVRNK